MRKQSILSIAVLLATMGGCSWEYGDEYKNYVTETGWVYFCPPKVDGKGENAYIKFNTLECGKEKINIIKPFKKTIHTPEELKFCFDEEKKKQNTAEDDNPQSNIEGCEFYNFYRLDYLSCINLQDTNEATHLFDTEIDHTSQKSRETCKKETPLCTYSNEKGFECKDDKVINVTQVNILNCDESENSNIIKCGDQCVDISSDSNNCGGCGNACETNKEDSPDKDTYYCGEYEGKTACILLKCKNGYHIKDNTCQIDTDDSCGNDMIDCTQLEAWEDGDCQNGVCTASKCKVGYHIYKGSCEHDFVSRCALIEDPTIFINCESLLSRHDGAVSMDCNPKTNNPSVECRVVSCKDNYHFNRNKTDCVQDSVIACGSFNQNCNLLEGIDISGINSSEDGNKMSNNSVECTNYFDCKAIKCRSGYHLYNENTFVDEEGNERVVAKCEIDDVDNCGKHGEKCNSDQKCVLKNGKYDCQNGCGELSECAGHDGMCFNLDVDPENCGQCGKKCSVTSFSNATSVDCNNGNCIITSCKTGYHIYNYKEGNKDIYQCEADTVDNCGSHGHKCPYGEHGKPECNTETKTCTLNCDYNFIDGYYGDCDNDISNGCEIRLKDYHMNDCSTCSDWYGDCDGDVSRSPSVITNGCETNLYDYGLEFNNRKCVCSSNYVECGMYNNESNIPLCLTLPKNKYNDQISTLYCADYCNNKNNTGGENNSFTVQKCNPKQACRLRNSNRSEVKCYN